MRPVYVAVAAEFYGAIGVGVGVGIAEQSAGWGIAAAGGYAVAVLVVLGIVEIFGFGVLPALRIWRAQSRRR